MNRILLKRALATQAVPPKAMQHVKFTSSQMQKLSEMLRVNQAGEIGANYIYQGQWTVFQRDPELSAMIQHMWDQEKHHLDTFNTYLPKLRARPSLLRPVWECAGFIVGMGSALLGKEAAMACTEAVETVIGRHYNDQLRDLVELISNEQEMTPERKQVLSELAEIIQKFRDDELEHLNTAVDNDAHKAPVYKALNFFIQSGCKLAIEVAKKV